jgi:NADP-dependent 3-hydroxy acid dehydrogenase YdfG
VGTGITAVGNLVVAITGSSAGVGGAAQFLFRKTGDAAYTVYRVA